MAPGSTLGRRTLGRARFQPPSPGAVGKFLTEVAQSASPALVANGRRRLNTSAPAVHKRSRCTPLAALVALVSPVSRAPKSPALESYPLPTSLGPWSLQETPLDAETQTPPGLTLGAGNPQVVAHERYARG